MFTSPPPTAPSPNQVLESYRTSYNALLAADKIKPLIYPYHFFGVYLVLLYLLIPHTRRPSLYGARWLVFAVVVAFEVKTFKEVRCMSMAASYGAGLMSAWCVIWSATLLVWNKPQWDFKRVERADKGMGDGRLDEKRELCSDGSGQELVKNSNTEGLRRELLTEGEQRVDGESPGMGYTNGTVASGYQLPGEVPRDLKSPSADENAGKDKVLDLGKAKFYWQSYPERNGSFRDRLDWVLDLLTNFRGPGWSWAIPTLPPLPEYITSNLENPSSVPSTKKLFENPSETHSETKKNTKPEMVSNSSIRKYNIIKLCIGCVALDILKTTMMHDPYFYLGSKPYAPPSHLPTTITTSPILLRTYRSLLTLTNVLVSLELVFFLAPLVFNHLLGPSVLGLRGHDFMYPPIWGTFSNVLDKGVAGLWGGWWHQTFRFAFSSPPSYLIKKGWIKKRSFGAKLVGLIVAFGTSGFLHFCGSYTQFGDTNPWHPPAFFMLQGVGILVQNTFSSLFHSQIKLLPKIIRRAGNFLFTFIWLLYTSPFLIDDFAGGGIWLYEPLPISVVRGLGFGREGDGWWCWSAQHGKGNGIGVGWYRGREGRWWESGVAVY